VGQQRSFTLGQPKDEAPKREAVSMLGRDDLFGSLFGSEPGTGAFNAPAPSLSMPVSAGVEPKPSEKHKKSKKKDEKKHSSKRKHKRSSSKSKHKSKKRHKDKIKKSKSKKHRYSDSESSSGDSGSDPTGSDVCSASDGEDVDLDDLEAFEKKFMADEMKRVVPPVTSSSGDGGKKVVVVSGLDARGKQIGTLAGLKSGEDTSMPKPSLITYDSDGSITGGLEDGTGKKAKKKLKTDDGAQQQQKDMHQAVALERKLTAAEEKCWYCFRNPAFKRHMMVSMGEHVYLALPLVCGGLHVFKKLLKTVTCPFAIATERFASCGVWTLLHRSDGARRVHTRLG
jgi:Protein similar to CwfJ C-terminus 1